MNITLLHLNNDKKLGQKELESVVAMSTLTTPATPDLSF